MGYNESYEESAGKPEGAPPNLVMCNLRIEESNLNLSEKHEYARKCLRLMLRSVIRYSLRSAIHVQDVLEAVKVVFVDEAQRSLQDEQEPVTVSRISAMSGIHRREVGRILERGEVIEDTLGLINRVIGMWQTDKRFLTSAGNPRVLSTSGSKNEFKRLCDLLTKNISHKTILMELNRIGAIEKTKGGVKLVTDRYVPLGDLKANLNMLARDSLNLAIAIEENIFDAPIVPNVHSTTEYDNIRESAVPEIKAWLLKESGEFHAKVREYLSKYDQDIGTGSLKKEPAKRVAFGTYSLATQPHEDEL